MHRGLHALHIRHKPLALQSNPRQSWLLALLRMCFRSHVAEHRQCPIQRSCTLQVPCLCGVPARLQSAPPPTHTHTSCVEAETGKLARCRGCALHSIQSSLELASETDRARPGIPRRSPTQIFALAREMENPHRRPGCHRPGHDIVVPTRQAEDPQVAPCPQCRARCRRHLNQRSSCCRQDFLIFCM